MFTQSRKQNNIFVSERETTVQDLFEGMAQQQQQTQEQQQQQQRLQQQRQQPHNNNLVNDKSSPILPKMTVNSWLMATGVRPRTPQYWTGLKRTSYGNEKESSTDLGKPDFR